MKVVKTSNYVDSKTDPENHIRNVDSDLTSLFLALQSRVRFGDATTGTYGENLSGKFVSVTTSATPDAENTVAHSIGSVPVGFLILWQDKAGSLYQGPATGTAWTTTNIYVKSNVASVTFKLFILK